MTETTPTDRTPMRIAIPGATSQIARDLVQSFSANSTRALVLYVRRLEAVLQCLSSVNLPERYSVHDYGEFSMAEHFDELSSLEGVWKDVTVCDWFSS